MLKIAGYSLFFLLIVFGLFFKMVIPSKIEWDLTNGPLSKLLELLDTQV